MASVMVLWCDESTSGLKVSRTAFWSLKSAARDVGSE